MLNTIYMPTEGIENDLLSVIWQVVVREESTGKSMGAVELTSPVRSEEVLATIADMLMGVGEEVDRKFWQRIV